MNRVADWKRVLPPFAALLAAAATFAAEPGGVRAAGLAAEFRPSRPLQLIPPEEKSAPRIVFRNTGEQPLELDGEIAARDYRGEAVRRRLRQTVPAGGEWSVPVPGEAEEQGVWRVEWRLTDRGSGKLFHGSERFGRMIPAGATPERSRGFRFGLCSNLWRETSDGDRELQALAAALCGVKIQREALRWSRVEPEKGRWDFSAYDAIVERFAQSGIELQTTLISVPRWAIDPDYPPLREGGWQDARFPEPGAFREFVRRAAERYRGKIRFYEVVNEPDLPSFANYTPEKYLELQKIAYETIKAVDPEARVMNGGIASIATDRTGPRRGIIARILQSGSCDVFAFHGHGDWRNWAHQMPYVQEQLAARPLPWYANETGVSATVVGERSQAETLYKKLLYTWTQGAIGYNWYNLRDTGPDPKNNEHNFGLLTHDYKPKAAYLVYNMLAANFRNGEYEGAFPCSAGLFAFRFRAENGDMLLAFWREGGGPDRLLCLDGISGGAERIDLMGNRRKLAVADGRLLFKVTSEPVTLRIAGQTGIPRGAGELAPRRISRCVRARRRSSNSGWRIRSTGFWRCASAANRRRASPGDSPATSNSNRGKNGGCRSACGRTRLSAPTPPPRKRSGSGSKRRVSRRKLCCSR